MYEKNVAIFLGIHTVQTVHALLVHIFQKNPKQIRLSYTSYFIYEQRSF